MASPSLLDINVDTLFEQHSILEIDQIHKKLQNDVEAKKEELRTMVGERYRDLLKAADTIGDMRNTAESVTKHIDDIIGTCRSLNDQQLIGFKSSVTPMPLDRSVQNFYGIAVQIKLLTQLPEMIWSNIDREDYFVATQLFIFSRHISTGLQLDINRPIMHSFPVARQLWSMLSPFFYTIKQSCMVTLEREDLSAETASKCLASILILENCPMEKLLSVLVQARGKAFKQTLAEDAEKHERVSDKLLRSLRVLIDTLDLIYKCFIGGSGHGLVVGHLEALTSAQPTISLIETDDPTIGRTLPDIISKFKPHVQITELKSDILQQRMNNWLQTTANDSKRQIKSVVDVIASVRTIHKIKTEAFVIKKPTEWPLLLQKLSLPANLDLYEFCYQPLISERIKNIIEGSWKATISQIQREVQEMVDEKGHLKKDKAPTKWTTEPNDIPQSLKQALSSEKQCHRLLMKSKGYTDTIINICQSLDTNLQTIHKDLNQYLNTDSSDGVRIPRKTDSQIITADHTEVIRFLQDSSREGISELITKIKTTKCKPTQMNLISLATLLQAIVELCPNLKLCLFQNNSMSSRSNSEQWDQVCKLLEEESLQFWKKWIDQFVADFEANGSYFNESIGFISLTKDLLTWETIKVEEKDEQDQPVESVIRVPAQPSVSLQSYFHGVCAQLNRIGPYTLKRIVTQLLMERLTLRLADIYNRYATNDFIRSNQTASLQCYFDVKFINLILVTRENKKSVDYLQNLADLFKANIDPFDFELFHRYVQTNIKKSAQRMQHKLGCIIPHMDHLISVLNAGSSQTTATLPDKEPNVLALSTANDSASGWFSLLPIMTAGSGPKLLSSGVPIEQSTGATKKTLAELSSQTSQQHSGQTLQTSSSPNLANVKSGAAAFFGAMSPQDWFR